MSCPVDEPPAAALRVSLGDHHRRRGSSQPVKVEYGTAAAPEPDGVGGAVGCVSVGDVVVGDGVAHGSPGRQANLV